MSANMLLNILCRCNTSIYQQREHVYWQLTELRGSRPACDLIGV